MISITQSTIININKFKIFKHEKFKNTPAFN